MMTFINRVSHASQLSWKLTFHAKQCRNMSNSVIVRTAQGELRGKKAKTKTGGTILSFQGVRYAKPPVGPLRFLAPKPLEPWTGVHDALAEGNVCQHKDPFIQAMVGDEDCLFLNVFTQRTDGPPKAVMVFFHGGGFNVGSGNSDMFGPDFLVAEDVVLVTLNYRLGVLGFLTLESAGIGGNAGLKDQVSALKWVRQNIAAFGGDPNKVTIFGESAGAACVHYHMLSPMSQGLFHGAICHSGTALNWWALARTSDAVTRAFSLARMLSFSSDEPEQLLVFLRQQPAAELIKLAGRTANAESRSRGDLFPFIPTIEVGAEPDTEVFLPERALSLLQAGRVAQVPYMAGVNSHEGILMLRETLANKSPKWVTIEEGFEKMMIPLDMNLQLHTEKAREIALRVKSFYFNGNPISYETRVDYCNLITDFWFGFGVDQSVKLQAVHSSAPVFYSEFSFDGAFSLFKRIMGFDDMPGACHADDLGYLFSNDFLDHDSPPDSPEMKTLKRMVKMWTNFAKTGNPSIEPGQWPAYTVSDPVYMDIGDELIVRRDRLATRMIFWEKLYQEVGTLHDQGTARSKL